MNEDLLIERLTKITSRLSEEQAKEITEKWDTIYLKVLSRFVDKIEKEYQEEGK